MGCVFEWREQGNIKQQSHWPYLSIMEIFGLGLTSSEPAVVCLKLPGFRNDPNQHLLLAQFACSCSITYLPEVFPSAGSLLPWRSFLWHGEMNLFPSCNQYQSKRHLYSLLKTGTNIGSFIIICHQAWGSKSINSNVHLSSPSRCACAQLCLHLGKTWTVSLWSFIVKLGVFVGFVFTWT